MALYAKLLEPWQSDTEKMPKSSNPVEKQDGKAEIVGRLGQDRPVYRCTRPCLDAGIKTPIAISPEDPAYSEAARANKFHGVVLLHVVVNEAGRPEVIGVASRLGHGLAENSVAAVARWKFKAGTKDGQPVAFAIAVEMSFDLY